MRNCLILGSARSGTSMLAGTLREAGYHIGDDYIGRRDANPKGFFEDSRINRLNERLVGENAPRDWRGLPGTRTRLTGRPRKAMWAACLPGTVNAMPRELVPEVEALMGDRRPFAYKDPRFCYTLPAWRPYLPADVGFVCIFREPARTANSIVKEVGAEERLYGLRGRRIPISYIGGLAISYQRALAVWTAMYRAVLSQHHRGAWLFLHYDQLLAGKVDSLSDFLGVRLVRDFSDPALRRSPNVGEITGQAQEIYARLLDLAGR